MQSRRGFFLLPLALIGGLVAGPARSLAACAASCASGGACTFDQVQNVALGNATLSVNNLCHLVVGNIGQGGEDGFSQLLPLSTGAAATELACPNFSVSKTGDRQVVTCRANVPGGVFYTATVENIDGQNLEIHPDFSPIGAKHYTLTVLNGGSVVRVFSDLPSATFRMQQGD